METPSSTTRRVTRSQAIASSANTNLPISRKTEESEKGISKSRKQSAKQQDRSALIDITNDSPIVGLAMGSLKTPSSTMSKKRNNSLAKHGTPGSGEALLRGQVKTLLQKVEEEAELSKLSSEHRPFLLQLQGLVDSPMGLLAPTPANTPHVLNLSADDEESFKNSCLASVTPSPVQEQFNISQLVADIFGGKMQEGLESENSLMITRSLLMDFSEKSESPDSSSDCSTVLTYKGGESETKEKSSMDDDDASVWSIQVNTSTRDEEEEEEEDNERECESYYDELEGEEEDDCDRGLVDELCKGLSKISVNNKNGGKKKMGKLAGGGSKHTRFVYNSDGELEGEEESSSKVSLGDSPCILRLRGLPTPKGKHLRFPQELEEEEEEDH